MGSPFDNGGDPYHTLINSTEPNHRPGGSARQPRDRPATGVWGTVRDQVAAVVAARGTFGRGKHG